MARRVLLGMLSSLAVVVTLDLGQSCHAGPITARAAFNGMVGGEANGTLMGDGSGVSVAGAKVFNPIKEDYKVSSAVGGPNNPAQSRAANNSEVPRLQKLGDAIATYLGIKKDDKAAKQRAGETLGARLKEIKQDLQVAPPAFPELPKIAAGVFLETGLAATSNPLVAESATGTAKQTLQVGAPQRLVKYEQDGSADIDKRGAVFPGAIGFGVNRDPLVVEWETPTPEFTLTLRDLVTDPSNPLDLSLTAQATGGGVAVALYIFGVSFVNFDDPSELPSDLASLEDGATELFEFSILLQGDGTGTGLDFGLELLPGATITDSLLNTTRDTVLSGLDDATDVIDGEFSFNRDYSLTVSLPGSPTNSVLFIRDFGAAAAAAVPEPSTLALVVMGLIGIGVGKWGHSRMA
jgi:hypothetical protein